MSTVSIDPTLPEELIDLGLALGVLRPGADGAAATLNADFFSDPAGHLGKVLGDPAQRDAALALAARLVADDFELDVDLTGVPEGQTWIPLATSDAPVSGVYLVVEERADGVLVSLGGRVAPPRLGSLDCAATALVPVVKVYADDAAGPSGAELLIGTAEGVVSVAATVDLAGGLGAGSVELSGASIDVRVPTDGADARVALRLRGLKLPGDAAPRDVVIDEGEELAGEAIRIGLGLVESQAGALSVELGHLLALLGLHTAPPIPPLPVEDLFEQGLPALGGWLDALLADPAAVRAWLTRLAALLGATGTATGDGETAPYRVRLHDDPGVVALLWLHADPATGVTVLRPGLEVTIDPTGGTIPGELRARVELCSIALGPSPAFAPLPALELSATLGSAAAPLVDLENDPGLPLDPLKVQCVRIGFALDAQHRPAALLQALGVVLGESEYDVLDLSSVDAIVAAAGNALRDVLATLVEALGGSPEARALLTLAGFDVPAGAPDDWPDLVSLSDLFAKPLETIAAYHARVAAAKVTAEGGEQSAWRLLAGELGTLLTALGEPVLAGAGTAGDPWLAYLFDNTAADEDAVQGAVALAAWLDPGTGGQRLHLGVRVAPEPIPVGEAWLEPAYVVELAAVQLPAAGTAPASAAIVWVPSHTLRVVVGDDLELDAGPFAVRAERIALAFEWTASAGFGGRLAIVEPGLRIDDEEIHLPTLEIRHGGAEHPPGVELVPWSAIERLAGERLARALGDFGARAAALLGWIGEPAPPPIRLAGLPELALVAPAGAWPRLSLARMTYDPAGALGTWLRAFLPAAPEAPDLSLTGLAWLASLLGPPGPDGSDVTVEVHGSGRPADPWAIPAGTGGAELLAWLEPAGPALGGLSDHVLHLLPTELTEALDGGGAPPAAERLVALLRRAGAVVPELREALGERADLGAALEALRERIGEGDGLVRRADQTAAGFAEVALGNVAHLDQPAAFDAAAHLAGGPPAARRVFVSAPLAGAAEWPGQTAERTIDLTAPGLAPEALDLSAITGPGPWFVRLPARAAATVPGVSADDGLDALTRRLRRTVDAARAAAGGQPVALVAHSAAGIPARLVASDPAAGVSHLVTFGAPLGGATFEFLDQAQAGEAVRLLQRLRALAPAPAAGGARAALEAVLDTVGAALDDYAGDPPLHRPFPARDFLAPAFPPLPGGVTATAVTSGLGAGGFGAGTAELVRAVLDAAVSAPAPPAPTHAAFGLRARLAGGGEPSGAVAADVRLRADLLRVGLADGATAFAPRLAAEAALRRVDGWLAGGPGAAHADGTPRDPRVRWAELRVEAVPGTGTVASAVALHDAAIFGRHQALWRSDSATTAAGLDATALSPELRALLSEAARACGPLPTAGSLRGLVRLLEGLRLAGVAPDGTVTLPADPVERFLVDPLGALRALLAPSSPDRATAVARLAELAGVTALPDAGAELALPLGAGAELAVTLGPPAAIALRSTGDGVVAGDALTFSGALRIDADGAATAVLHAGPPATTAIGRRHGLVVRFDTAAASALTAAVERSASAAPPADVAPLLPEPDLDALGVLTAELIAGELLRIGLDVALGDAAADFPIRDPAALLLDPAGWLRDALGIGATGTPGPFGLAPGTAGRILDAIKPVVGLEGDPGEVDLPWGFELAVSEQGAALAVALRTPPEAPLVAGAAKLAGSLGVVFPPAGLPVPTLAASLILEDLPPAPTGAIGLDRLAVTVGFEGSVTAAVTLDLTGSDPIVIPLVPSKGLGALAELAADVATEQVLPLVLDHVADSAALSPHAGLIAEALGLRDATTHRFVYDELAALALDPAGELLQRLGRDVPKLLQAADSLAKLLLADTAVEAVGRTLTLRPLDGLSFAITIPEAAPVVLCVEANGVTLVDGLAGSARACASEAGLVGLSLAVDATGAGLLKVGSVSFFPFVKLLTGDAAGLGPDRLEAGLWLDDPGAAGSSAIVVQIPFTGDPIAVVCRTSGAPDSPDLEPCLLEAVRSILLPLLLDQVLGLDDVDDRLRKPITGTATAGGMLEGAKLLADAGTSYVLADGALNPAQLGNRALALGTQVVHLLEQAGFTGGRVGEVTIAARSEQDGGHLLFGVRLGLTPAGIALLEAGGVKLTLETDARWLGAGAVGGVDLLFLSLPAGDFDPAKIELRPLLRVTGVGLRARGHPGPKLIEGKAASVESIAVHGVYEGDFGEDGGVRRAGGRVTLDKLSLPLGRASAGDNPVAAKLLSQESGGGSKVELAPAVSPQVVLLSEGGGPLRVRLAFDGNEEGPWWFPVGQKFGPIYVGQVGLDTSEKDGSIETVTVLLDGGVSLLGLTVDLDDLSVAMPFKAPWDVKQWRLGLAGLGVGYTGSGASIAGGLRKRSGTPPDYVGLLLARFGEYGLTVLGGYAEYPTGTGSETYTSLFLFGALSAPLGGPPPFFVTGIGAGAGLNRRLLLPAAVDQVPSFPLVAAMDPQSPFAKNQMQALDALGTTFPPERGALWFAAGVRFTSFALVNSIAVLSVSIGEHLEVALLGLSRMTLPRPEAPVANLELALRARFSTRDGVLAIQAQLTDNSWLISQSCRLTGGFAFVIWFRTGQFVLTLGGYHPSFARPQEFPLVPRLGFNWAVSNEITVKGEAYFALTATCVMAGGRLEASYQSGAVWANFVLGMDVLIAWAPVSYDFRVYVSVSAGVEISICVPFLGCARKRISLSLGADVHVWGPKLRGEATLDLSLFKVTVRFGSFDAAAGREPIGWSEFRQQYLVAGDPQGLTMGATVMSGQLVPEAAPGGTAAQPTGLPGSPWLLAPEFELATRTRSASSLVQAGSSSKPLSDITAQALGVGPMKRARVSSVHRVTVTRDRDDADVTDSLAFAAAQANVPEGVWRLLPDKPVPEAKVRPALVGASLTARATLPAETVRAPLERFDPSEPDHPLPFHQEVAERGDFEAIVAGAQVYVDAQPTTTAAVMAAAEEKLRAGAVADERSVFAALTLAADRVAPPTLAPLGEGMVAPEPEPVTTGEVPPAPPPPDEDTSIHAPVLAGVLRGSPPVSVSALLRTTAPERAASFPRVPAPSLAEVKRKLQGPGSGRLELFDPEPRRDKPTVVAADAGPATSRAGGLREARGGLRVHPEVAGSVAALQGAFATGAPLTLTAGDVHAWQLPNAERDVREQRPAVVVKGDQHARVVVLDRAGAVVADAAGRELTVAVPLGARTVALVGRGAPLAAGEGAAGLPGWHGGSMIAQVAGDAYLAGGCVLRTTSPDTLRGGEQAVTAIVRAADAVRGRGVVSTRFPAPLACAAVAIETALEPDELMDGLVLGLEGALRARDASGDIPPRIVVSGARAYAVFALRPEQAGAVTVTVASDERWTLAGTFASRAAADAVADRLTAGGLAGLLAGLVDSPLGSSSVTWAQPGGTGAP